MKRRHGIVMVMMVLARAASADPLDDAGTGAAGTGMASARTALAVGAEAAHVNPAGLARVDGPEVLVGWQFTDTRLRLDGRDAGVANAHGTALGLAAPIDLGEVRTAIGMAVYLPDQYLARLQLFPTGEPQFARFGAASQRIVVDTVAAIQWHDLAVGAGLSVLADARSKDLTFDVGVKAHEKVGAAHLDIDMPTRVAPIVGLMWTPHPKVQLGATFRGELALELAIDNVANVDIPNVATGAAVIKLRAMTDYTPMKTTVGAAVHVTEDVLVAGELAWERWSTLGSAIANLDVDIALDLAPPLVAGTAVAARFHDIVTPRLGLEWMRRAVRLRAGVAYLPSPVPAQRGITSLADGARVQTTLGAGWRFPPNGLLSQPIDVDIGASWQHVRHMVVDKDPTLDPGGAFSSGGDLVQIGASTTVRF